MTSGKLWQYNYAIIQKGEHGMGKYIGYHIYECPNRPDECGKYYGKTPIWEQAIEVIEKGKRLGKNLFIKGVKPDGKEVIIL